MTVPPSEIDPRLQRLKAYESVCQFGAAIQLCQQGLRDFPDSYEYANHLGRYLLLQGRVPEAVQIFQKLLRAHPDDYMLASNLLFYRHYASEEKGEELFAAHQEWARKWTAAIPRLPALSTRSRSVGEKLHLGFVSPDFRRHPVASFVEPLLRELSRDRFSITCYARSLSEDAMTSHLRSLAGRWRAFGETEIATTARQIREDQIDVLIDLAGHTPGQSLLLFAAHPAPVQCTYLGYPNTTGLAAMEVRLVDPYSDPPGLTEAWNTERLVRLPETAWCYQPSVEAVASDYEPPVSRQGRVTFGSFNALCKISDACLRGWAEILQRVPDSRLLVKNYALQDLEGREAFQRRALLQGVPIERVDLLGVLPGYLHYQAYRMVDIMLDTYPYHGTTTTCEALWMGVPVVTLAGKFHVSRVGASLLHQVQADDLIATSPEEYIALAVTLAGDPNRIRDFHQTLRKRMQQSPLTNAPRFARNFEACIESLLGF